MRVHGVYSSIFVPAAMFLHSREEKPRRQLDSSVISGISAHYLFQNLSAGPGNPTLTMPRLTGICYLPTYVDTCRYEQNIFIYSFHSPSRRIRGC